MYRLAATGGSVAPLFPFHPCAFRGSHEESAPPPLFRPPSSPYRRPFVREQRFTHDYASTDRKPEALDRSKHARAHFYPRINMRLPRVYVDAHTHATKLHTPSRSTNVICRACVCACLWAVYMCAAGIVRGCRSSKGSRGGRDIKARLAV